MIIISKNLINYSNLTVYFIEKISLKIYPQILASLLMEKKLSKKYAH